MSSIRQSNLFAAEDFRKVYKVYNNLDFTAYDYNNIKSALIDNIKQQYPEDFNDYVQNSEFIAIIEQLAFLGTTLAFRTDLNTRNNILPLTERRDAILDLVRLISYKPKRNKAATGLFKIESIKTTQSLSDAEGNILTNIPILWNDANNENWYDQFITIFNEVAYSNNKFGRPSKLGTVNSITSSLYQLNNVTGTNISYPLSLTINGEALNFDIVNADFINNVNFVESHPDQNSRFNIIFRNDTLGYGSKDSGFFFMFKQGRIQNTDFSFKEPEPNRVVDIDLNNINEEDVYVQQIDINGNVTEKWINVPSVSGNNIVYNSLELDQRNIYEVITRNNDNISIKFTDGTFGNIPTGLLRVWTRISANKNIVIRPDDAEGLSLSIPYIANDNQTYIATFTFSLQETLSSGEETESNENIKTRAPQTYYSQSRMVNNEDYNVFPLSYGNEIAKIKATNRTMAGHSRYIDQNDPTGFNKDLIVLGQDGALYKEYKDQLDIFVINPDIQGDISEYVFQLMQNSIIDNSYLENHFYNEYIGQYIEIPGNENSLDFPENAYWKTSPTSIKSDTGYLINDFGDPIMVTSTEYKFFNQGSVITFETPTNRKFASISKLLNGGVPYSTEEQFSSPGPVILSQLIEDNSKATQLVPQFRRIFTENEASTIMSKISVFESFGLGYNVEANEWYVIFNPNENTNFVVSTDSAINNVNSWQIIIKYVPGSDQSYPEYHIIARGIIYAFESLNSTKFYWDESQTAFDPTSGLSLIDSITLFKTINVDSNNIPLAYDYRWALSGKFINDDGYRDVNKIEVTPYDADKDGIYDNPLSFNEIANTGTVIFSKTADSNGYTSYRIGKFSIFDLYTYDNINDIYNTNVSIEYVSVGNQLFQIKINNTVLEANEIYNVRQQYALIVDELSDILDGAGTELSRWVLDINTKLSKVVFRETTVSYNSQSRYYRISISTDGLTYEISQVFTDNYKDQVGISFEQNTNTYERDFYYKWQHYAPIDNRIDPSPTNIVDLTILTTSYQREIIEWKNNGRGLVPLYPTNSQLKSMFNNLEKSKMISDQLVYRSGRFKILFGNGAENELKANFKIIKSKTSNLSDNEIKSKVVSLTDTYFSLENWNFGETFYFTELAAYIHSMLINDISSVVIVPQNSSSQFGDLFEVSCESDELFISTATVNNIEIVSTYTESNLRM